MASHKTSSEREEVEVTLKLPGAAEGTINGKTYNHVHEKK